jgi:hypothetical protein
MQPFPTSAVVLGGLAAATVASALVLRGIRRKAEGRQILAPAPAPKSAAASQEQFVGVASEANETPLSAESASPRSPGVARKHLGGKRRLSQPGTEDPWRMIEGDRKYELGKTTVCPDLSIDEFLLLDVPTLQTLLPERNARLPNLRQNSTLSGGTAPYFTIVDESAVIIADIVR